MQWRCKEAEIGGGVGHFGLPCASIKLLNVTYQADVTQEERVYATMCS